MTDLAIEEAGEGAAVLTCYVGCGFTEGALCPVCEALEAGFAALDIEKATEATATLASCLTENQCF